MIQGIYGCCWWLTSNWPFVQWTVVVTVTDHLSGFGNHLDVIANESVSILTNRLSLLFVPMGWKALVERCGVLRWAGEASVYCCQLRKMPKNINHCNGLILVYFSGYQRLVMDNNREYWWRNHDVDLTIRTPYHSQTISNNYHCTAVKHR